MDRIKLNRVEHQAKALMQPSVEHPDEIRFFSLVHILGVSPNTLYLWRWGAFPNTPILPVVVRKNGRKNDVRVNREVLRHWLKSYRPHLLARFDELSPPGGLATEDMRHESDNESTDQQAVG